MDFDALIVELRAQIGNLEAQTSVLQSSYASLSSEVDAFRMRINADLIGGVSEDVRTLWTDLNALLEILRGYPKVMGRMELKFNQVMARL